MDGSTYFDSTISYNRHKMFMKLTAGVIVIKPFIIHY
jgi:hypothetical protein